MTKECAIDLCRAIDIYLCAGNPIWDVGKIHDAMSMAIEALKETQWIPCSEKLPSNDDFVIVTVLDEHGDTPYRYSDFGWYLNRAKCWIIDDEQRTDVIAWAPLPEPYKGE